MEYCKFYYWKDWGGEREMKKDIWICSVCGEYYCAKCSGVFTDRTYICSEGCLEKRLAKEFEQKLDRVFDEVK